MTEPLSKSLKEVSQLREREQAEFDAINNNNNAAFNDSYSLGASWSLSPADLHVHYREAFIAAADEFRAVSECLDKVRAMLKRRRLDTAASTKNTLAVIDPASQATKLASSTKPKKSKHSTGVAGAMDVWSHDASNILPDGLECTALIEVDGDPQLWCLVAIAGYKLQPKLRYSVLDLDENVDTDGNKPPPKFYHNLDPRKIIPLPSLAAVPLSKRKEFRRGSFVLALFPDTTSFYKAEVIVGPKKRKDEYYTLKFHDDGSIEREISARYVCPFLGRYTADGGYV